MNADGVGAGQVLSAGSIWLSHSVRIRQWSEDPNVDSQAKWSANPLWGDLIQKYRKHETLTARWN